MVGFGQQLVKFLVEWPLMSTTNNDFGLCLSFDN